MDFRSLRVDEWAGLVRDGEASARELVDGALDRIEGDADLHAFVAVDHALARAEAGVVDRKIAAGEDPGPLAGVPIGVKDLEDASGYVTTYGSALHTEDQPATEDSVLVRRLKDAGAVVVGKTNTPEFGHKGTTDNLAFGPTRNPWDRDRSPGGSSGGTSAAIAAGLVPLGTGSDGGGSIRIPSALCGLTGFKPTAGLLPLGGPHAPGSGLLSVRGPMTKTAAEVAVALDVCVGPDDTDIFSLPAPLDTFVAAVERAELPGRIVWSPTMGLGDVDGEIAAVCAAAVERLVGEGVDVVERDAIFSADPVISWLGLWCACRARTQGHLRGTPEWDRIDPSLQAQIELGLDRVSGVDHASAVDALHDAGLEVAAAFEDGPLIVTPATAGQTPDIATGDGTINGERTAHWVKFTYPLNMTRHPAGVVPCGATADGMPVALQVIGRHHHDLGVLAALAAMEQVFGTLTPPEG